MSLTKLTAVTADRQLELPPDIQATLQPGDEYLIWQTEDTIMFKKIQKPISFAAIRSKVESLGHDPEQPTLEEISQIVREIRQQD